MDISVIGQYHLTIRGEDILALLLVTNGTSYVVLCS